MCGGLFSNRNKFFDHCKRQAPVASSSESSFKCSYCGKIFALERLLRDHMRAHINHYKCPLCDMTCPTPSNLNQHMNYRHNDERPYACGECNYRAKSVHDLSAHAARLHGGGGEQACPVPGCGFVAATSSAKELKAHLARKEGDQLQGNSHGNSKEVLRDISVEKFMLLTILILNVNFSCEAMA